MQNLFPHHHGGVGSGVFISPFHIIHIKTLSPFFPKIKEGAEA
jgi:hypothetical protein